MSAAGFCVSVYSPVRSACGVIFLMRSDIRHAKANDKSISPMPASVINTTGTLKVHLTIPILLKNRLMSGFIIRPPTIIPITVEIMIAGIKDSAVCNISCFVVKPSDFKSP